MRREWFWCLHCERAFQSDVPDDYDPHTAIEEIGQICINEDGEEWWRCPYEGCDGTPLDFMHWSEYREDHPESPQMPVAGVVYPMYED